mgnify:CR=1 FL=1
MSKSRKPTMKEVKLAIDNILVYMSDLQRGMQRIDSAFGSYIEFKKDKDKFNKWLTKEMEKLKNENSERNENGGSNTRNKQTGKSK